MATNNNNSQKKAPSSSSTAKKTTSASSTAKSGTAKSTPAKKTSVTKKKQASPVRREIIAGVFAFLAILSTLALFGVDALFINILGAAIKGLFGWGIIALPLSLVLAAWVLGFHKGRPVILRSVTALLLPVFFGALAHLLFRVGEYGADVGFTQLVGHLYTDGRAMIGGGVICGLLAMLFEYTLSIYGAFPLILLALIISLMISMSVSLSQIADWFRSIPRKERVPKQKKPKKLKPEPAPDDLDFIPPPTASEKRAKKRERARDVHVDDFPDMDEIWGSENGSNRIDYSREHHVDNDVLDDLEPPFMPIVPPIVPPVAAPVAPPVVQNTAPLYAPEGAQDFSRPNPKQAKADLEVAKAEVLEELDRAAELTPEYSFPPIDLLRKGHASSVDGTEEIAMNRQRLELAIKSFGVAANVVGVTRGPTVTRYDLELDVGVKLNKLLNLSGDLALALGVTSVRIAPIPDKISTVGVEVPNKLVSIVYLREIVDSAAFNNAPSKLSFAIGKDIGGAGVIGNIAKLPHMLIAGTTGSGKSVCVNSLLLSLLYKSSPEELRFIMIDPKMVELGIYNGIPHLFVPVVTDPKKAAGALQWAVIEMLKRYRLFSECGVRDLAGYNAYQKRTGGETMPQIVIVVDELADLMLCAAKEVEESICRVAQMGRASGMHLIIATQRPSADVITGLMKANIPSRIAFAVSSALESRIILDTQGAEKLVGMGDMLYYPLGSGKPQRVQGAFVSDEEREDIINHIKSHSSASYSDEILEQIEKAAEPKKSGGKSSDHSEDDAMFGADADELFPKAVEALLDTNQASVSMLQRRLKIGFSRAGRLIDQLEEQGIVGPPEGSKPRRLLITRAQWQERLMAHSGDSSAVVEDYSDMHMHDDTPPFDMAEYEDEERYDEGY